MTVPYRDQVFCPHCRRQHAAENSFNQWVRRRPDLDSRNYGLVRFDCDVMMHRYKVPEDKFGVRDLQFMMFIEVKTHGAAPDLWQKDSLHMLNQVLRNRRPNRHAAKKGAHAEDHIPLATVYSLMKRKHVPLRMVGGHFLQLEGNDPADSNWMRWDKRDINEDQLISLLKFDLDPDWQPLKGGGFGLVEMDLRRRSYTLRRDRALFELTSTEAKD